MKFFILMAVGFFISPASAMNVEVLNSAPYETLKAAFRSAGTVQIEDFPRFEDMTSVLAPLECVAVIKSNDKSLDSSGALVPVLVGRIDIIFKETQPTPGNGPLFPGKPGTPGRTVEVVSGVMNFDKEITSTSIVDAYLRYNPEGPILSRSNAGDLQTTFVATEVQGYELTLKTTYKKSDEELFFHQDVTAGWYGVLSIAELYGYCYRRN
jgi:hypothetical protein